MIYVVRNALDTVTGHGDEIVTDVNSSYFVAQTREVFAKPPRAAAYVENPGSRRQREYAGHVCEVGKVTMGFGVHTVAKMFFRLISKVIKGFRPEIVTALRIEHLQIVKSGTLVINAFDFWQPATEVGV